MSTSNPFGSGNFGPPPTNPSFGEPTGYDHGYGDGRPPSNPALGIVSLSLGGLGFVTSCCCGLFGIPIPVLAIIVGIIALFVSDGPGRAMGIEA